MTTKWVVAPEKERLGVVIYNYQNDGNFSLKLEVGDTVHNLCQEEHWYFGYSVKNRSLKGIYPKSYVRIQESTVERTAIGEHVLFRQPPLVQEINSVVKEWGYISQSLYVNREMDKWKEVCKKITDLIRHRSKILSGTLTLDELRELKQTVTSQIDYGNNLLNLDMVVRDNAGNILNPDSASVVHLYRQHMVASNRIKRAVAVSRNAAGLPNPGNPKMANRHSHMFFVTVQNFVCGIGEDTELLLCLFDAREWRPLTENYVVRWTRSGKPLELDLWGNQRVLFSDLGSRDLSRERVYLVCHVVRVGNMEVREDTKRGSNHTPNAPANMRRTTVLNQTSQTPTYEAIRRPCGVAAMDVSAILSGRFETDLDKHHSVPFVSCGDRESLDSTLRRVITRTDQKEQKGQCLWVSLRLLHGDLKQVSEEHPALMVGSVAMSRKLGFPEIILPGDVRHDLYLTLVSGEFSRGSKSVDKNVEVTVRVCNERGQAIPGVLYLGSGVQAQDTYRSVVYYHEDKPKWTETIKIVIPIEEFYRSHLKFTFKHRSSSEAKDRSERPFSMAFVKLMQDNGTTLKDTQHELLVYKMDHRKMEEEPVYLSLPSTRADLSVIDAGSKPCAPGLTLNSKDSLLISSCLCSTKLTQNVELLGLLKYHSQPEQLPAILQALMKVDGEEVVKFLQDVLDALFNILMQNSDSDAYDRSVFECLVFIIGLVADHNYEHFKPVLDVYIKDNFSATLAYEKLLVVLKECIQIDVQSRTQGEEQLRVMKSLRYILKFVVRSRQLFVALDDNEDGDQFEALLRSLFDSMATFMKRSDDLVLLAQGACLKYIPCAIPDLLNVFDQEQLSKCLTEIVTSVPVGRLNNQKMTTLNDIVHSQLFRSPECRAILLPLVVKHIKDLLTGHLENGFGDLIVVKVRNQERSNSKAARILGAQPESVRTSAEILFSQEVEICVKVLCDLMDVLHSTEVGPIHDDINEVMMNGLRTIIQTIIAMDRDDPSLGHLVAVMLSIFRQMEPHHYRGYLDHFATRSDLLDFLIEILLVFKDLVARQVYPQDWAQMIFLANSILLKALRMFSHTIRDCFSNPFEKQVWNNYFYCAVTFVTQPALQIEPFSQSKRRQVLARYRDMRREMSFEIRTMWFNLGQHKIHFVPAMVGPFLEMTLLPETELRKATIPIFFDMMQCEFYSPRHQGEAYSDTKHDSTHIKASFQGVEDTLISQLDVLVEGGRGDEHYKDLLESTLTELCEKHSRLCDQGLKFVRTVTRLIERLLEYRSIITDENRENRMSCTVNLLDFYNEIGRQEMYIRYLNKLCDLHLECDNFTEAGYTLQLHARLLHWTDEPLPTLLRTSRHPHCATHRQLKEALYVDSIDLFDRGKMWECAVLLGKELVQQYEQETFDYGRLGSLLTRTAGLYDNIIKQLRPEPEYFRVAFYGRGFPAFLQNKIFVFRGKEYERLSDFTNRILLQFPNAEIMSRLTPPDKDIVQSPQQYLQINKVDPMIREEDEQRFSGKNVHDRIVGFYRVNNVQRFSFSRPFHRGPRDEDNTFSSLWLERTILTTSHVLPGILRWFPVVDTLVFELSPLETAIETMETANRQLTDVILAHRTDVRAELPLSPLSMKLNGIVDAAVNGGINNYEKAFFTDQYLQQHPKDEPLVAQLQELFARQIPLIEAALVIHRSRVNGTTMEPLHLRIEDCFVQMRNHVESKYGKRSVDPTLEHRINQLTLYNQPPQQRGSGSGAQLRSSANMSIANRASNGSFDTEDQLQPLSSSSVVTRTTPSMPSTSSGHRTSQMRQSSTSSLFSRSSTQTNSRSSLSFSMASTVSLPSAASSSMTTSARMLGAGRFRERSSKSIEKKLRDKENKQQRDSFRRLSASSASRSSPFPALSLAFGLGSSSTSMNPPTASSCSTPPLGSSTNSLEPSSSTEAVNVPAAACPLIEPAPPVVIELTQQLTSKRPLRSEASKERRSAALARSTNGLHERVSSSPSQNSIESTISSSSCDDVPPPLPVKQNAGLADANTGPPPEKPALHANFTLLGIEEDAGQPPPPPPKKPQRVWPPAP